MKKVFQLTAIVAFVAMFFIPAKTKAQGGAAIASPRDSVSGVVNGANISINYGAPSVKGRKIFGDNGLQPYGKMWRAGANVVTTFTTDKEISFEGKKVPAGKYSLFVTPGEKEFIVTLNSETGQWGIKRGGVANEDPTKDVVVVSIKPKKVDMTERLKYVITKKGFELVWETTSVPVSIK